jgi:hypothetical protein
MLLQPISKRCVERKKSDHFNSVACCQRKEERGGEMKRVGKGRERIYHYLFVESKEQTTHIIDENVIATKISQWGGREMRGVSVY